MEDSVKVTFTSRRIVAICTQCGGRCTWNALGRWEILSGREVVTMDETLFLQGRLFAVLKDKNWQYSTVSL